ncbi:MAG: hypothetical protein H6780_04025 [Candidatus Nomurabacteria bacterium]|nr:MAG: hypothetical protein H6780_04025 [Candidatus Nomurabacteria bacterium]
METNETQKGHLLKEALFARIESEKVCPRPKYIFWGKECSFWVLWGLAVLVGALAFAVTMLVTLHGQYALYEATHENFFTFMVDVLPYLWIFILGLVTIGAVYNVRHTKRGYRYPVWMIVASSVVLSFAGGSALHYFGLGYRLDEVMGQHLAMYMSQEKMERELWQVPEQGRLVGRLVYTTVAPTTTVVFEDSLGQRWRVEMADLTSADMELLASKQTVRLLGMVENETAYVFHACGAFPWMLSPETTVADMSKERENFVQQIVRHRVVQERFAEEVREAVVDEAGERTTPTAVVKRRNSCADLDVVKRMPE